MPPNSRPALIGGSTGVGALGFLCNRSAWGIHQGYVADHGIYTISNIVIYVIYIFLWLPLSIWNYRCQLSWCYNIKSIMQLFLPQLSDKYNIYHAGDIWMICMPACMLGDHEVHAAYAKDSHSVGTMTDTSNLTKCLWCVKHNRDICLQLCNVTINPSIHLGLRQRPISSGAADLGVWQSPLGMQH